MSNVIIGLSGDRQVGKSKVADHLVRTHGFHRVHPFNGGKAATRGYLEHIGVSSVTAHRMTDGDLKDLPCDALPVITNPDHGEIGCHYTPRFWMEKFGQFMGIQMGPDWTIGRELKRLTDQTDSLRLIVESIVFEADVLQGMGGIVIEIQGPIRSDEQIDAMETRKYGALIRPDLVFLNDKETIVDMGFDLDNFLEENFGIRERQPDMMVM